jgi:hypothetical protein
MESKIFNGFRLITMTSKIRLVIIGKIVRSQLNREYERSGKNVSREGRERNERDKWQ